MHRASPIALLSLRAAALLLCCALAPSLALARPRPRSLQPANPQILQVLDNIHTGLKTSAYRPVLRVDERRGRYEFDCSAMAGWVLQRSARRARAAIGKPRPLARDFVRAIEQGGSDRPQRGWLHIARVADAQPGDILTWRRPPWFPSKNTGHVAFVVEVPRPFAGGLLVRIADATSLGHGSDTRAGGQTGFGMGTLWIAVDPVTGAGTGYGWQGELSAQAGHVIETPVLIGRAMR